MHTLRCTLRGWLAACAIGLAPPLLAQPVAPSLVDYGHAPAQATLRNTYWKLIALDGQAVTMLPGQEREVRITLHSAGMRLAGFGGCQPLAGTYLEQGQALTFTVLARTPLRCAPAIEALQRQVDAVLAVTSGQRVDGQFLSLLQGGRVLARFEAVYL